MRPPFYFDLLIWNEKTAAAQAKDIFLPFARPARRDEGEGEGEAIKMSLFLLHNCKDHSKARPGIVCPKRPAKQRDAAKPPRSRPSTVVPGGLPVAGAATAEVRFVHRTLWRGRRTNQRRTNAKKSGRARHARTRPLFSGKIAAFCGPAPFSGFIPR